MYKYAANHFSLAKKVIFTPECQSTNALLYQWSQNNLLKNGDLLITNHQTQGKGQRGNTWYTQKGQNLTFSFYMLPSLPIERIFEINFATSLAISDFLKKFGLEKTTIKWPNDIYVGHKKIAGILIENSLSGSNVQHSIVGIGLNVLQTNFSGISATSIRKEIPDKPTSLSEVFSQLLNSLDSRLCFTSASLKDEYLSSALGYGDWREYAYSSGKRFSGKMVDIDPFGRICLETPSGRKKVFDIKEIKFLFPNA